MAHKNENVPQNIQWVAIPNFSPNLQQKCKKKPPKWTVVDLMTGLGPVTSALPTLIYK